MKIYYAHPMSWYDHPREEFDVEAIGKFGPNIEVVNPNGPEFKAAVDKTLKDGKSSNLTMALFFDAISDVDAIAYRTFDDGYLGAGVASEILQAFLKGKAIYQIMDSGRLGPTLFEQSRLSASFGPRVLTIIQTRDRIKRGVL